ncbi:hypothetical protein F5887DRAFT_1073553 [Amanita rubescens]|nr:hypothetical protein F5887DRAFT_1073553 [Amanita rubescens]
MKSFIIVILALVSASVVARPIIEPRGSTNTDLRTSSLTNGQLQRRQPSHDRHPSPPPPHPRPKHHRESIWDKIKNAFKKAWHWLNHSVLGKIITSVVARRDLESTVNARALRQITARDYDGELKARDLDERFFNDELLDARDYYDFKARDLKVRDFGGGLEARDRLGLDELD